MIDDFIKMIYKDILLYKCKVLEQCVFDVYWYKFMMGGKHTSHFDYIKRNRHSSWKYFMEHKL